MKLTQQQIIIAHSVSVPILIIAAFYGGMRYEQSSATAKFATGNRAGMMQAGGGFGGGVGRTGGRGGMNGGFATGEILSKDATTMTIKLRDGGSKIILLSDKTQVVESAQGKIEDLAVGGNISVNGTANPDGSVTAESIQIRPAVVPGQTPAPAPTTPAPKTN